MFFCQITQHKWAWPFMQPVDVEGLGLHDYYEVYLVYAYKFPSVMFALVWSSLGYFITNILETSFIMFLFCFVFRFS